MVFFKQCDVRNMKDSLGEQQSGKFLFINFHLARLKLFSVNLIDYSRYFEIFEKILK